MSLSMLLCDNLTEIVDTARLVVSTTSRDTGSGVTKTEGWDVTIEIEWLCHAALRGARNLRAPNGCDMAAVATVPAAPMIEPVDGTAAACRCIFFDAGGAREPLPLAVAICGSAIIRVRPIAAHLLLRARVVTVACGCMGKQRRA